MYGYWRKPDVEPTAYGQALQQQELYDPTTRAVAGAYVGEAYRGVGTGYADFQALSEQQAEGTGKKLTEEEFKNNPDYHGLQWHDGMTDTSANVLKEFNDETRRRQAIIADSSSGQAALGFIAGFGAGVVEPKNLAIGVATSAVTGGLSELGVLGNTMRRLYQAKKAANIGQRIAIGAVEGVGAGVVAEPSNRYSAKTLQQDYTMADSLFNIATSTAFGAAIPAGHHVLTEASPFIREKIDKFRGRTMDVVAAEQDLATQQFVNSQRVNVSAVEAHEVGNLVDRPVVQQAAAAERFVRFTESPEFKARFEGSKVVDTQGTPLRVYHGTAKDFTSFDDSKTGTNDLGLWGRGHYFSATVDGPNSYALRQGDGARVLPSYVNIRNPLIVKTGSDFVTRLPDGTSTRDLVGPNLDGSKIKSIAVKGGHDGVVQIKPDGSIGDVVAYSAEQIIPAFGDKSLSDIIAQADTANAQTIAKHNAATIDPRNDTLIDYDAIDAADERKAIQQVEGQAEAEAYLQEAQAEIQQMLDQDVLNEADLAEYQAALEELNATDTTDALNILHTCLTRG